jgi:hypothetical protein
MLGSMIVDDDECEKKRHLSPYPRMPRKLTVTVKFIFVSGSKNVSPPQTALLLH